MDEKTKNKIEYEHQFFGFSSDTLIDSYKTMLKTKCESAVNGSVKMLSKKLLPVTTDPSALEKALEEMGDTLKCHYERGVEYGMKNIEPTIRECLLIPDELLLPEDRIVATVEGVDTVALDAEILELQQELKTIALLTEELKEEQLLAEETISSLEQALNKGELPPLPVVDL